jgi:hypothetical protein
MPAPIRTYGFVLHSLMGYVPGMHMMHALASMTGAVVHLRVVVFTGFVVMMTAVMLLRVVLFDLLVAMVMMGAFIVHMHVTALLKTIHMTGSGHLVVLVYCVLHFDLLGLRPCNEFNGPHDGLLRFGDRKREFPRSAYALTGGDEFCSDVLDLFHLEFFLLRKNPVLVTNYVISRTIIG